LRAELVTTMQAWRALADDWERLLRATPGYTGLQSFDFLSTWWRAFGDALELRVLAFYDGPDLIGIAPLQIVPQRILGRTYRVLQFIGMTEDILRPTVLFPEPHRERLLGALAECLIEQRRSWDLLELDELVSSDSLIGSMRQLAAKMGWLCEETPFHRCPFLELSSQTWASYLEGRSGKLRKNLRAGERRLAESGAVDLEVYRAPGDIHRGLERYLELARLSWKHAARLGMAGDARYEAFYARLLETFARHHGARALILTAGGRPVAATLAVLFDDVYYSLQIVHDEAYARCSPGTVLEARELELLLRERDAGRYEFMGGALSNKLRWTSEAVDTVCIRLAQPDLRLRAVALFETAKRLVKRVLESARSAVGGLRGRTRA
ncbi:MAG TPA: GNAT family N-acetyltransferase, partial [Gammaproteobacteria bacterium]|nr:GNAT family N-acetyltransferase [Gammaproteobacteria bacterium]